MRLPSKLKKNFKITTTKKRKYIPRSLTLKSKGTFIRRTALSSVYQAGSGTTPASSKDNFHFSFGYVPNIAEIRSMFDKIKLLSVDLKWIPKGNYVNIGTASYNPMQMYYCFNNNNENPASSELVTMRERNNLKSMSCLKGKTIRLYPTCKRPIVQQDLISSTPSYEIVPSSKIIVNTDQCENITFRGFNFNIPETGVQIGSVIGEWQITYNMVCYGLK